MHTRHWGKYRTPVPKPFEEKCCRKTQKGFGRSVATRYPTTSCLEQWTTFWTNSSMPRCFTQCRCAFICKNMFPLQTPGTSCFDTFHWFPLHVDNGNNRSSVDLNAYKPLAKECDPKQSIKGSACKAHECLWTLWSALWNDPTLNQFPGFHILPSFTVPSATGLIALAVIVKLCSKGSFT